jgi:hypothetical protein
LWSRLRYTVHLCPPRVCLYTDADVNNYLTKAENVNIRGLPPPMRGEHRNSFILMPKQWFYLPTPCLSCNLWTKELPRQVKSCYTRSVNRRTWDGVSAHASDTLKYYQQSHSSPPRKSSLTHSQSWALLEKPQIVQLLKNFPAFYGTRRFITVFTRALH